MAGSNAQTNDWFDTGGTGDWRGRVFQGICLGATLFGILMVGILLVYVTLDALALTQPNTPRWLDWQFLTEAPSRFPEEAGIYPALIGSIMMMIVVAVATVPLGVGAALYLVEYAPQNRLTELIQLNIANLAGVPSVVYGLLGLALFIRILNLPYGSVLVGGLAVGLLILPIVIIASQEAIDGVPDSQREASLAMGATRWQTVRNVVLPEALPGILTGTILAFGRAIGETAPLLMIGAAATIYNPPSGFLSRFSAMPRQIYTWSTLPSPEFRYGVLAAGVVTLLAVMLSMNAAAILIRNKYQRR